ncbi:tripartite motif-containing protein 48-like [Polyodon spathula]|uniref:tripartite motif-containing protein 48-like n=1 Tax=Polyodon spathula TaxID=7913 RepID=UPI001B7EC6F3|nr:tripartite motif-containing protein 48-like [Polyodon spathula]
MGAYSEEKDVHPLYGASELLHTSRLEELSCAVCCDIFSDPVTLSCNHSFCKSCLDQCWKEKRPHKNIRKFTNERRSLRSLVCQISKKHENHKCCPVEEAAQDYTVCEEL